MRRPGLFMVRLAAGAVAAAVPAAAAAQTTWYVDDDNCPGPGNGGPGNPFCAVQDAVDTAADGDEILVAPGWYAGTVDLLGKAVTLRAAAGPAVTVLDAQGAGTVVRCANGEGPGTVLAGFTITGGSAGEGAGMRNAFADPTVLDCVFTANAALFAGGGMYNLASDPLVIGCAFVDNSALVAAGGAAGGGNCCYPNDTPGCADPECEQIVCEVDVFCCSVQWDGICAAEANEMCPSCNCCTAIGGGGMHNEGGHPTVINCAFRGNMSEVGGGMSNLAADPVVINCTFTLNTALMDGAIHNQTGGLPDVVNCILWGDEGGETGLDGAVVVLYSDVQGGHEGEGNIDADPLLADPAGGDLRLSGGSPCIDAGDNTAVPPGIATDLGGDPRFADDPDTPDGGSGLPPIVDMGAYEFQPAGPCPWDLNGDGKVGVADLLMLLAEFGSCDGSPADFNGDGCVTVADLLALLTGFGPCPGGACPWDVNGDGTVGPADVRQVAGHQGPCAGCPQDVNADGVVNGQDVAAVATHFGPCP